MALSTLAPTPPPRPLQPHPTVRALLALVSFVRRYLSFGAPGRVLPLDDDFRPFWGIDPYVLQQESYSSTILCYTLAWFLTMAGRQRKRHRPACGGWTHPNLLSKEDLHQQPRDPATLKGKSTVYLCDLLREELRLLLRLLRAAQRGYWRHPAGVEWEHAHRAAMQVLIRIVHICARLRKHANRWYAEQCLRRELYWLWFDQFGPTAILPDGAYKWLETIPIPDRYERRILKRLLAERKWGYAIPAAFQRLYTRWEQGLEYPEVQAPPPRRR